MKPIRNLRPALAAAISFALGATNPHAATITVTSGDDIFHSSTCNLRNAVTSFRVGAAQGSCAPSGNFGDNDTVTFAPALANSTITLARGEIFVAGSITIIGSGQTIDANYGSRVMYLNNAALVASNLTLTHGYTGGLGRDGSGAGVYVYGGSLTLTSVTISHSVALGDGAGISVSGGSLSMSHSTVSGNVSALGTGGVSIYDSAATTISDSAISNNSGARVGGIAVFSGYSYGSALSSQVAITRSTIGSNSAVCSGGPCAGGIYSDVGNFITIGESTISGNSASGSFDHIAGGLYAYDSVLSIANATIALNSATGNNDVAGGMWHTGTGYGQSTVVNSTISANLANTLNASVNVRSGIMLGYGGNSNVQLRNSIIAGNENGADFGALGTSEAMTSCLAGTIANVPPFNSDASNHFIDTPGLGPLQSNGGPMQTMAPLLGSIAIDAGNNAFTLTNYDQRGPGFARVFDGTIDIGAVEFQGDRIFAYGFEPGP
jgi:hypothetical protein